LADGDFGDDGDDDKCLELFLEVLDIFLEDEESLELLRERLRSDDKGLTNRSEAVSNGFTSVIGLEF